MNIITIYNYNRYFRKTKISYEFNIIAQLKIEKSLINKFDKQKIQYHY